MSEAEFEREAAQLFQNLGLQLGKETLDFFTSESVHKSDWKSVLKRPSPSPPRRRRVTVGDRPAKKNPGGESSIKENEKPRNGSVPHFKKVLSTPPRSPASSNGSSKRHRRTSEGSKLAGARSQQKAKPASTEKHPNALHIATSGPASSINAAGSGHANHKNGILRHSTSSTTKDSPHTKKPPATNETDSSLQTQAVRVPTHDEPKRNGFPVANSTSSKLGSPMDSSNTQVIYSRKPSLKILSVTTTSSSRVHSVKDRSDESSVGSPESIEKLMSPERMEKRITPENVEKRMLPVHAKRRTSTEKRKSVEVAAKPVPPEHAKKRWSRESADRRVSPEDNEKPPQLPPKRRPRSYSKPSESSLEFERPRVLSAPRSSIRRNGQLQKQSSEPISSKSTETAVPSHWKYDRRTSPEPFVGRTKSPDTSSNERKPDHSIYRLPSEGSRSDATPSPIERESVSTSVTGELRRYSRSDSVCSSESGGCNHTYAILEPPGFSYFGNSRASPSPEGGDLRWYDSMDDLAISPEDLRREGSTTTSETKSEQQKAVLDRSTQFQSPSQMPTVSALATDTIHALSTLMEALTPSTEHLDRLPYLANAPEQPSPEFESTEDDIDSSSITISSGPTSPPISPEVSRPTSSTGSGVANRPVSITPEVTRPASTNQRRLTGLTIETDLPVTTYAEDDEEFFGM